MQHGSGGGAMLVDEAIQMIEVIIVIGSSVTAPRMFNQLSCSEVSFNRPTNSRGCDMHISCDVVHAFLAGRSSPHYLFPLPGREVRKMPFEFRHVAG
jgi:hypothetical protein